MLQHYIYMYIYIHIDSASFPSMAPCDASGKVAVCFSSSALLLVYQAPCEFPDLFGRQKKGLVIFQFA